MRLRVPSAWQSIAVLVLLSGVAQASLGDRLPDFKDCLQVCTTANCGTNPTPIPLHRRLLLWTCPAECDYTCQHIVTDKRLARDPPYMHPVYQFHGKWPFYRFLGLQEPFSVIFSLLNFLAHDWGMARVRERIPASYPLRKYYIMFGYVGLASWTFSMVFHARDFGVTEKLDYFGAGANVLYGMYYAPIRVFKLAGGDARAQSLRRAWTGLCATLYALHVLYLSLWSWDYTYNMAANVVVGALTNILWAGFSYVQYQRIGRAWAVWPGVCVAIIISAMSLELMDFPPWQGAIDAHSLWHLGTVLPTVLWYNFLVRDAQEDMAGTRLKR
ncbi:Mn2+ homeostasis protein-like protein Per1 [Dothidotthia symphoricarpi CBS 119687]|uniref:Post-GPI attachment to proteins factor 3 n=1 Tax=Dothidotthia symphoricarpi CBS 119687 TaxID=1392245 RepID=A0A6A6ARL5_9PLEO|nr:Mn2+ homeostasis protein-like protein Per1 [Dothidotthia symphoricarpi CBS 119687]KAF2133635.1 Mn2+ homeostasis protein-like protein Per1 [Dothidotthia symphoricarpi CBS 119687]